MFKSIVDATPRNLEAAMSVANAIIASEYDDKAIIVRPAIPNRDLVSFDVTDFAVSVTFYL